jgi:hypothetical protein
LRLIKSKCACPPSKWPNISSSGQRLRRSFAERDLPEIVRKFTRVSPGPPLPLSIAVGPREEIVGKVQVIMDKISAVIRWIVYNSFFISIVVFVLFYLWWFRLTPFVFLDYPTQAFLGGSIMLIIYSALSVAISRTKHNVLKPILSIVNIIFFAMNFMYLDIHIPRIKTTANCNGVTYYITRYSPLLDERWTYVQESKWKGYFNYESHFYGYDRPGLGEKEIICEEMK